MKCFELAVSDSLVSEVRGRVEGAGLRITLETTLAGHPGSLHFHIKRGRETGTLEFTYVASEGRAWLSYHENRYAPWIDAAVRAIQGV